MQIKRSLSKGFTLIELLIVVVILGILAAVVVPQLSGATDEAKVESLRTNLARMRAAIDLYRQQHNSYPSATDSTGGECGGGTGGDGDAGTALAFANQLTMYTDVTGTTCNTKSPTHKYGPYLKSTATGIAGMPRNPITDKNVVTIQSDGSLTLVTTKTDNSGAWLFDYKSGKFIADDNNDVVTNSLIKYSSL